MGKVWEATQTWERLENCLGKFREGKVMHGKTLGGIWEEFLFIVNVVNALATMKALAGWDLLSNLLKDFVSAQMHR